MQIKLDKKFIAVAHGLNKLKSTTVTGTDTFMSALHIYKGFLLAVNPFIVARISLKSLGVSEDEAKVFEGYSIPHDALAGCLSFKSGGVYLSDVSGVKICNLEGVSANINFPLVKTLEMRNAKSVGDSNFCVDYVIPKATTFQPCDVVGFDRSILNVALGGLGADNFVVLSNLKHLYAIYPLDIYKELNKPIAFDFWDVGIPKMAVVSGLVSL